jgi:3-phenylpropionate/trans-cinnamate dioxygenase ferredoxin reductase component
MSASGLEELRSSGRIVIVGASLAGLRAAEALRDEGFTGALTLIGDERYQPYDRPPLSKQVASGWTPPEHATLPRLRPLDDVEWRLGVAASGLDRTKNEVRLADGSSVPYDRVLIATGVRSRTWPNRDEAALKGVLCLRSLDDARALQEMLDAGPDRVLVIGAGFTGSEVASVCRDRNIAVTVVENGPSPLAGALGGVVGRVAAELQHLHGVDLRCHTRVKSLEGDARGRMRGAVLSDDSFVDADVAVVCLGAVRNTEWLNEAALAAGPLGIACDAGCRAVNVNGLVSDDVFAAGDVARLPHPVYEFQFVSLEHWNNAVVGARIAAHNMVATEWSRVPHIGIPAFWSNQFGVNIKSVGVPNFGDQLAVVQGSLASRRFVAIFGHEGRTVAAVAFDHTRWLQFYEEAIARAAPFPPFSAAVNVSEPLKVVAADFPEAWTTNHHLTVTVTGHNPIELRAQPLVAANHR